MLVLLDDVLVIDFSILGEAIRAQRVRLHMTQAALAKKVLCQTSHLSRVETGQQRPSLDLLFRLAIVMEMSLDEILKIHASGDTELRNMWFRLSELSPSARKALASILKEILALL